MAEPVALIAQIHIKEEQLKSFLRKKSPVLDKHKNIDVFASLLYSCENNSGNIFLFHFENDILFTAYWLNYYHTDDIKPFKQTLHSLCKVKEPITDYAFLSDSSGLLLETYALKNETLKQVTGLKETEFADLLSAYWDRFWSFSDNNNFPEPSKALRKRNYFYKPLKSAYKRYLKRIEEIEKPLKIKAATKENPYYYAFDDSFLTYDNKVFYYDGLRKNFVELPGADPYTFGLNGFWADKNHFYNYRTIGKPTVPHKKWGLLVNNPDAKIEFFKMKYVDPLTAEHVGIYMKDKNHIYIRKNFEDIRNDVYYGDYKIIPEANLQSFEFIGFVFAKDKNRVFIYDKVSPIHPDNYQINKYGFIWDDTYIFHFKNSIDLDAKTFQFVKCISHEDYVLGVFLLTDKNGTYEYHALADTLKKIKT